MYACVSECLLLPSVSIFALSPSLIRRSLTSHSAQSPNVPSALGAVPKARLFNNPLTPEMVRRIDQSRYVLLKKPNEISG